MPLVQGRSPWSFLSSPSASPLERASAVDDLGGGGGIDLSSAFSMGSSAAGGGMGASADDDGGDAGLSSVSPMLIKMAQAQLAADSGADDTPTSEDKGLALAQAGFGMAAGESPHALTNIGAGALGGVQALARLKQQRAVQRMRESQLAQQTALREAALVDQAKQKEAMLAQAKASAQEKADIEREKIQAKRDHDKEVADARAATLQAKADADADRRQAAEDRAKALADTRYTQADLRRRENYQKSGQWTKIAGDEERGITGAPAEDQPYNGPLVDDPSVPLRDRNKLKVAKPGQLQAVETVTENLDKAIDAAKALKTHPGLPDAVGFLGETRSKIPGTQAASFAANLHSLLSQQFAQSIQAMRDASKTGGAVGNVSDKEGDRFENMVASLAQSQDEKQFTNNLDKIIKYGNFLKGTYADKYKATYGELPITPDEDKPGGINGPPAPKPAENAAAVQIKDEAEYNALPSGTAYIDPTGTRRVKK